MSKNFANIYNGGNPAIALEQKVFLKAETVRGTMVAPAGTDFLYQLAGGGLEFERPAAPSPVRSGRHNTTVVQDKDKTTWSFPSYFMIDSTQVSAADAEIDQAVRTLWTSMLGVETAGPPLVYTSSSAPATTFSLFVNGDMFAHQAPGAFVQGANCTFPGDGKSQIAWSGSAKTVYKAGIAKSTIANSAHTFTCATAGDALNFDVGAMVMIIKSDGTTRSADTPTGTPRTITAISGAVITLSGAVLADADGSTLPVYLCYYEPTSPTAINDPQTGLVGSVTIGGLTTGNVRSLGLNLTNNHEEHNYYWGQRGLGGPLFTPGSRLNVEVTMELNMTQELLGFIIGLKSFAGESLNFTLGPSGGRNVNFALPKVIFPVPKVTVPETGSIPVTFTGTAYQTAVDAADELTVTFQ